MANDNEYIDASDLGEKLFGEIVFVNPAKREEFTKQFGHLNLPLKECFHVTNVSNISNGTCSIIRGMTVYKVDPNYFLTRNHDYKPYQP